MSKEEELVLRTKLMVARQGLAFAADLIRLIEEGKPYPLEFAKKQIETAITESRYPDK